MSIRTSIARGYAWRNIILAIVCAVFGAWGAYDYAVDIPRRQQLTARIALIERCKAALETEQDALMASPEAQEAITEVAAEWERLLKSWGVNVSPRPQDADPESIRQGMWRDVSQRLSEEEKAWMALLVLNVHALRNERHLPLENHPQADAAYRADIAYIDQVGTVAAPAKYDRIMQWLFIACLPLVPYFLWTVAQTHRRRHALDDDGTLHTPQGAWGAHEIADVDMSRWMAKSIATVIHRDGSRVRLDDYKHRNMHLIVGALASRLHPEAWTADARPQPEGEGGQASGAADVTGPAAEAVEGGRGTGAGGGAESTGARSV
jgi:hypothetical protein